MAFSPLFRMLLVGAIAGVLIELVIPRKGWGHVWITVLIGVGGSVLGVFVARFLGFFNLTISPLLGALILLVPYALRTRAAARGSVVESTRGETLSMSPRISSLTAQTTDVQSDESPPPPIGPHVSNAVGEIFLSYASPDRPTAQTLAKALQNEGWSVWWDRTIPPGKSFDEVIEAALEAARCVIVLWSRTSVNSDWVKVEAAEAAKRRILIPALIAEVTIPLEFRRLQAADLIDWPGSDPNPGFQSLLGSIADLLGKPKASRARPSAG